MYISTLANHQFCSKVLETANAYSWRFGQTLFNLLPQELSWAITSSTIDPFHKHMSYKDVCKWVEDHLVFSDDGKVIAIFNNNEILAEIDQTPTK